MGEYVPEARLDHYWPEFRVAAEGDGLAKYLIGDAAAAIRKEKEREWLLQRLGIRVVRYTWSAATRSPAVLVGRIRELLREGSPRSCDIRMWPRDEGLARLGLPSGRSTVAWPGRQRVESGATQQSRADQSTPNVTVASDVDRRLGSRPASG